MDFPAELKRQVARVERGLGLHVPSADTRPARLHTAMRYSLETGGKRLRPVLDLTDAAGSRRLIGGQMEDVLAERKADATADELEFIHLNKTAALIEAALVMGGLVGQAKGSDLATLRQAGRHLGLAFQIID